MTIEETIARSVEDHVSGSPAPVIAPAAVRRAATRRRRWTTGAAVAATVAVVLVGYSVLGIGQQQPRVIVPADVHAMDFDHGVRAFYDMDRGRLHLGGQAVDLGEAVSLDTSAAATPWGVVYFDDNQAALLLAADGSSSVLSPPPEDTGDVNPTVKFDARRPLVGWLTGGGDPSRLSLQRFAPTGAPEGRPVTVDVDCNDCAMAGIDHGRVFVRDPGGARTLVLDLADVDAGWQELEDVVVADVRNRVVLARGTLPTDDPLGAGWRFAGAEGPESLLTFDGRHELYWSSTLKSTEGGEPLRLDVPGNGTEFVALDSDGSVLVARLGRRLDPYYDCEIGSGRCTLIGRLANRSGDPMFLGADM